MIYHSGNGRKNLLILLLLIFGATITTLVKADFTPPSLIDWLGSGETTGIFSSGKLTYNITSGEQLHPAFPQISFRSNSESIDLGICVADFRLHRIEANGSLTQTDYAYFTLTSINSESGFFWASTIFDYPSTYRIGVVIWNTTDSSAVGRLTAVINVTKTGYVSLTTDKTAYTYTDDIKITIVNQGPTIETGEYWGVYRLMDGEWKSVVRNPISTLLMIFVTKDRPFSWTLNRSYADLSQPGYYMVEKYYSYRLGWRNLRVSTVFSVTLVPGLSPNAEVLLTRIIEGALIGGVLSLIIIFVVRKYSSKPVSSQLHS